FPVGPVLLLSLTGLFVVLAVVFWTPHPAIFALLPAATGVASLLVRERRFSATLTEQGLEIEEPPLSLPYTEIECVRIQGNLGRARAPIYVWYAAGLVRIPARVNVHSGDLYEFLAEKLPVSGSRELPPVLAQFCADQEGFYGADRVYTYRARQYRDTY